MPRAKSRQHGLRYKSSYLREILKRSLNISMISLDILQSNWLKLKTGDKGKPVERQGRKATGLRSA
jgi:hypothetical protein